MLIINSDFWIWAPNLYQMSDLKTPEFNYLKFSHYFNIKYITFELRERGIWIGVGVFRISKRREKNAYKNVFFHNLFALHRKGWQTMGDLDSFFHFMLIGNTYIHSPTHKFFSFFCITSDYSKGQEMCLLDRLTPGEKCILFWKNMNRKRLPSTEMIVFSSPYFSDVYFSLT